MPGMGIIGCGTDLIETQRLKTALSRWSEDFLLKIFTPREIAYARKRKASHEPFAARFAAKEAVFKAFGAGFSFSSFKEVEVLNDENGKPSIVLSGRMEALGRRRGVQRILISLTHTREYAQAVAILEG